MTQFNDDIIYLTLFYFVVVHICVGIYNIETKCACQLFEEKRQNISSFRFLQCINIDFYIKKAHNNVTVDTNQAAAAAEGLL